jgi:hypothetical protein
MFFTECSEEIYLEELLKKEVQKEEFQSKSKTKNSKEKKKIKYKGFTVNHKFLSSEDELKQKHTEKYLRKLFAKLKKKHNKNSSKTTLDEEDLPEAHVIFEAAKVVINDFPYEKLEGFNTLAFEENSFADVDMIKVDFINFTEADIKTNEEIIDDYYSQNLDYQVLDEIARNPSLY